MELTRSRIHKGIIFSVGVSILTIVSVIFYTQDELTPSIFSKIEPEFLVLAVLITMIFWNIKALKLKIMAKALGSSVSYRKVFAIFMASAFVSHVTPSSSGGLPFAIYFLHREGLSLGQSTALTVLENMLTLTFFMLLSPVILFLSGDFLNLAPAISNLFYITVFLLSIIIFVLVILIFNSYLASKFINWLTGLNWIKALFSEKKLKFFRGYMEEEVYLFREGMSVILAQKKDFVMILISTVIYWCFYLSLAPVLLLGLGINVSLPPVIMAQIILKFILPIIPTPGSSGGAELGFAYLFKFLIPNYFLGIFVALWRFFMFYFSLIIGGIYFISLVRGTRYIE
ncbi:MAG: lysylphosphatidylglycerol synthase transmembrane domain-containing protein [Halanaerobiaceae bacterium]